MKVKTDNFTVVIFGANSDLAARKLYPSLYELAQWGHLPDQYRIIGVGRSALSNEDFRSLVHEKLLTFSPGIVLDESPFKAFCSRLFYVRLDFKDGDSYKDLYREIMAVSHEAGLFEHILYYLPTLKPAKLSSKPCSVRQRNMPLKTQYPFLILKTMK